MGTSKLVSEYYISVASKYLAVNVTITEVLRKEALNEIRNAFAHVARADVLPDINSEKEYEKALGHLQRLALDSAKDTIFELRRKCETAIGSLEVANLVLPGSVHSSLADLISRRSDLTQVEVASPPDKHLVDSYGELMGDFYQFYRNLDDEFNVDRVRLRNLRRKQFAVLGLIGSFLLGTAASYLANHIPKLFS